MITSKHMLKIRNCLVVAYIFFLGRTIVVSLRMLIILHIITHILVNLCEFFGIGVPIYFPNSYYFMLTLSWNCYLVSFFLSLFALYYHIMFLRHKPPFIRNCILCRFFPFLPIPIIFIHLFSFIIFFGSWINNSGGGGGVSIMIIVGWCV